jgi:hypothetical protein
MSPNTSHLHITQPLISQPPRHYLVTPVTFLVLVCAQNLRGHCCPSLQNSFIHVVKKFWSISPFADLESCCHLLNLGAATTRQQDASPWAEGRGIPGWNVKSQTIPQIVGIKDPLMPKTDTQKTEKSLTRQLLLIKRVQTHAHSSWADMSTKWSTVTSPYIPDAVVPAPHLGFVQVKGSQSFQIG